MEPSAKVFHDLTRPLRGHNVRARWRVVRQAVVPARVHPNRVLDIYWLSTGRCGTHFLYNIVCKATNLTAYHDRGMPMFAASRAATLFVKQPDSFWRARLEDFPIARARIDDDAKFASSIFTEFGHHMFPFGKMLWDYYQTRNRRLKVIHLVREPAACCRSMLKVERFDGPGGLGRRSSALFDRHDPPAVRAAKVYNRTNQICAETIERIAAPGNTRTVRVEDLSPRTLAELLEFMEVKGLDSTYCESVFMDHLHHLRHSHINRPDLKDNVDMTNDEKSIVEELTRESASRFGYV